MELVGLDVAGLGNRTYVVVNGGSAVVVDPPRDFSGLELTAERHGARITCVLETHRHADYVSGGLALSRRHRASYVVPGGSPEPTFAFTPATDGLTVDAGAVGVRVLATPGHTPHHVSYVVADESGPVAVCTGGSLLHGSVGRTDLHGPAQTVGLAQAQWQSAQRLVDELPAHVRLLPTHGFGSLCSAAPASSSDSATLGDECLVNPALLRPQEVFVGELVAGYGPIPRHYSRLPLVNAAGPLPAPSPDRIARLDASDLADARDEGHWLVDVRDRRDFARAHLRGAVNVEVCGGFAAYLPWLLPPGAGVAVLGDDESVRAAVQMLAAVGIDYPLGIAVGAPSDWVVGGERLRSYPVRDATALARLDAGGTVVLDVRSTQESARGHLRGAVNLPLPELAASLDDGVVPSPIAGRSVWVYCAAGFRAAVAASLLDAAGVPVTLVDADINAIADAAGGVVQRDLVDQTDGRRAPVTT